MKTPLIVILLAALLGISGCMTTSLRSIATAGNIVPEPSILGHWQGVAPPAGKPWPDETYWTPEPDWVVESRPGDRFRAVARDAKDTTVFSGCVVRLGDRLFLALEPDSTELAHCRAFPMIPCHTFASLAFDRDTMIVGYLRSDWVIQAVKDKRLSASAGLVVTEEDEALLAGNPDEVRALLLEASRSPDAFSIGKLVRKR